MRLKELPMYYHDVAATVSTHSPRDAEELADLVKAMLGPWCISARAMRWNIAANSPTFLDTLEVPVRVFNVLRANGKETLEQICALKAEEFMRFKNAGRKSLKDLREELDAIGAPHNLWSATHHCGCPTDGPHTIHCPTVLGDMARVADSLNNATPEQIATAMERTPTDSLEWGVKFEALAHHPKVTP